MTGDRTCDGCHDNPVHDTFVCGRCQRVTQTHLADMENHRRELLVVLARQTRYDEQGAQTSDPNLAWARIIDDVAEDVDLREHPVPYSRSAARVLHSQRSMLVSWCRMLHDEYGAILPPDTVAAMSRMLSRWSTRLATHAAAGEYVHEVRALVRAIWPVVDVPKVRAEFPVGPCPHDFAQPGGDEHEWCTGQVWARVPADEERRPILHCLACDAIWYSEQWHNVGPLIARRKAIEARGKAA